MKATATNKWNKGYTPANDRDEEQPEFMFQTMSSSLLAAIARGEIDANELAKLELERRGLNEQGAWVGFKK